MDLSGFTFCNLIGGFIFSGIGFVAFNYGRKNHNFQVMGLGLALMLYTYFVPTTLMVYLIGSGLTAALFIMRD